MSGIYIHIPFCRKACTYCDFHFSTNLEKKEAIVKAIGSEIEQRKNYLQDKVLNSVYFGGGTPSVLSREEIARILYVIREHFEIDEEAEITFEMNPEDASAEYLNDLKKAGINRLSIGLQSFDEEELRWMNRAHSARQSVDAVLKAKKAGFGNITIDLIYGSRFQDENSWRETIKKAIELKVPHLSSYNLTIEGKTKLKHLMQKGEEQEVDTELSAALFDILMEETAKAGYEQYEISNFSKPGFMAVHNSNYWRGQHYLGVGPAAHSFNGFSRRFNVKSNAGYLQALEKNEKYWEEEVLSDTDRYNEYILTRLRTSWGCDISEIAEEFGHKYKEYFLKNLDMHRQYLVRQGDHVTLNQKGKHFADGIASDFFITTEETE